MNERLPILEAFSLSLTQEDYRAIQPWIADLRNPNNQQGFSFLEDDVGGHCCLGRWEVIHGKDSRDLAGTELPSDTGAPTPLPSGLLPERLRVKITGQETAMSDLYSINDAGYTFPEIADLLEAATIIDEYGA